MKTLKFHLFSILFCVLYLSLLVGCGSREKQDESTESAKPQAEATVPAATSETSAVSPVLTKPVELEQEVEKFAAELQKGNPALGEKEAPIQMTYYFIRALQTNNKKAVLGMLTQDAYRELANREDVPCPEFIQNSEVELGNVQYLSDEQDEKKIVGARVGTTWTVKTDEGAIHENIAWVFRFENDAWYVAGMISILDPKYPPVLINFEDLAETEQQLAELEKEIEKIDAESAVPNAEPVQTGKATASEVQIEEPTTQNGAENEKTQETVPSQNTEEPALELPASL